MVVLSHLHQLAPLPRVQAVCPSLPLIALPWPQHRCHTPQRRRGLRMPAPDPLPWQRHLPPGDSPRGRGSCGVAGPLCLRSVAGLLSRVFHERGSSLAARLVPASVTCGDDSVIGPFLLEPGCLWCEVGRWPGSSALGMFSPCQGFSQLLPCLPSWGPRAWRESFHKVSRTCQLLWSKLA